MNHEEQLRDAFRGHEHLAPDASAVSSGALELARGYRRRRWAARAAGGALVTAGLGAGAVVGGQVLPGLLDGGRPSGEQAALSVAAPVSPSATPSPRSETDAEQRRAAFFAAGYDYDDAVALALLWGRDAVDTDAVKADAGRRLLAGGTLPLAPGAAPAAPAPEPAAPDLDGEGPYVAFLEAGYDWEDAVRLAELWETSDVLQAKALAGQKLLDGETLPFAP